MTDTNTKSMKREPKQRAIRMTQLENGHFGLMEVTWGVGGRVQNSLPGEYGTEQQAEREARRLSEIDRRRLFEERFGRPMPMSMDDGE